MTDVQGPRAVAFDLAALADNVTDAITILDAQWRFLFVNRACERMVNKNREELLGRVFGEVFPEINGTTFDLTYRQAMKTQTRVSFEAYYAPLDIWLESRAYPSPELITIILRNINERKAAERALLQSEERFRGVFEAAPIGLTIVNSRTHQFLKVNAAMSRILGYTAEELIRLRFDEITHPDDRVTSVEVTGKLFNGLYRSHVWVKRYIRKDGSVIHAIVHITSLPGNSGADPIHMGIIEDITERVRTEEAFQLHSERLSLAQRVGSFGVFDFNIHTGEVVVSPELEQLYGVPVNSFLTRREMWSRMVHPDDRVRTQKVSSESIQKGTGGQMQFRIVRPDGNLRWIENTWSVVCDSNNEAQRIVGVSMDITDRKLAADSLREHQDRLSLAQDAGGIGVYELNTVTQRAVRTPEIEKLYGVPSTLR